MLQHTKYKEELCAILSTIKEKDQKVTWDVFVKETEELILEEYDGLKTLTEYKGLWKGRFRACAKLLSIKIDNVSYNHWKQLVPRLREKREVLKRDTFEAEQSIFSSPSTRRSKSSTQGKANYKLSSLEKQNVIRYLENLSEGDKWKLANGTLVEDQMLCLVKASVYEHPVHSLIIDPRDKIWKDFFTEDELKEIRTYNLKPLPDLSEDMQEILQQYEFDNKTALEMYEFADGMKAHPINESDKRWVKESIKSACELFFEGEELSLEDCSEADLLHTVWEFMYKLYRRKNIKAKLGERVSKAVSSAKNAARSIEVIEHRPRKFFGSKLDTLFKAGVYELGSCEIGKHDVEETDDKYMNDALLKLPKTLRDMLSVQVQSNSIKINELVTVGYLMMGLTMELVVMDIPKGKCVTRVTRTEKFLFPSMMKSFNADFLSLLELTWKGCQMMKNNLTVLHQRKRKAAVLITGNEEVITLAPSFRQQ
ncbi:hypothetical protein G6F56_004782 [Rhizopus delemar]|nr:hypothetical protein G6F56_004782 [Rhizopus delemar]